MDYLDIICLTCGASPDPDAPRNIGEWNDAGHTDSAHRPAWSPVCFKGSEWHAGPLAALWYAEAVIAGPDGEDAVWGYSDSTEVPPLDALSKWPVLEGIRALGRKHPDFSDTSADIIEMRARS